MSPQDNIKPYLVLRHPVSYWWFYFDFKHRKRQRYQY